VAGELRRPLPALLLDPERALARRNPDRRHR
jgi:hypothetical protein